MGCVTEGVFFVDGERRERPWWTWYEHRPENFEGTPDFDFNVVEVPIWRSFCYDKIADRIRQAHRHCEHAVLEALEGAR